MKNQWYTCIICLAFIVVGCNESAPISSHKPSASSLPTSSEKSEYLSQEVVQVGADSLSEQAEIPVETALNGKWVIQRINETDSLKYSGTAPYIDINGDTSYSAYLGCNNLQGSLHVTPETLRFSHGPMTARACDPSNSESELRTGLFYEFEWMIANDKLTLTSCEGQTEIVLQKQL